MINRFQENLKKLAKRYTQKYIAEKTNFSQSSINNYLSGSSEPSMQFLIALKEAFGISIDGFLFSNFEDYDNMPYDKFVGNYIVYYYNNNSYKGEVNVNVTNTLNYGVISILKERDLDNHGIVYATFVQGRAEASKLLKEVNQVKTSTEIIDIISKSKYLYKGRVNISNQIISIELKDKDNGDFSYILLNNPPSKTEYIGGIGTVNSVSRGREHNPCVQYIIISRKIIEKPDGELYNCLKLDNYIVKLDFAIDDILSLFKRLYVEKNEISIDLSDNQKRAIIQNKLDYHFYDLLEANTFRFAKVSNKEDDTVYRLIRRASDDWYR